MASFGKNIDQLIFCQKIIINSAYYVFLKVLSDAKHCQYICRYIMGSSAPQNFWGPQAPGGVSMLTKGAIGNLVNRYRAVLRKCRLLNTFGSLAVAGALVLGGAGAAAAAVDWPEGADVRITAVDTDTASGGYRLNSLSVEGGSLAYTGTPGGGEEQLFITEFLNISGGELSVNQAAHAGIQGAADSVADYTAIFNMSGGKLSISGSQVQMKDVNISGGEVSVSGIAGESSSTNWNDGAMLGSVDGTFALSGDGKITLGDNAQLFAPEFNLNGGTISMSASDNPALVRTYGENGALNLTGAAIEVDGQGILAANNLNISGGNLGVGEDGNLIMGVTGFKRGMSVSEALKSSSEATVTQTGGTVNVAGRMDLGGTLNIQGGEFTVGKEGKVFVLQNAADAPAWGKNSAINMQGGVLNVDGYAEASQLSITGGTTNIIGDGNEWHQTGLGGYSQTWDVETGAWVASGSPTMVSGPDTVVNIENGNLFGGVAVKGAEGGLTITDGAIVNLSGDSLNRAGMLFASDGQTLNIARGASVNVAEGQHGVFNAATTTIGKDATVDTAGTLIMAKASKADVPGLSAAVVTVEDGGTMRVTGKGYIDLGAKDGSSSLTFADGSLFDVSAASVSNDNTAIRNATENAVHVAENAKLRVSGAKAGESYTLASNSIDIRGSGWQGDNLLSSTSFLGLDFDPVTGTFTAKAKSAAEAMPELNGGLGNLVSGMYAAGLNDADAIENGRRFLSRVTDVNYIADAGQQVTNLESAARMGLVLAPHMTWAAHDAAGAAVARRAALAQPEGSGFRSMSADGTDFGMWVMPLYQNWNADGLDNGSRDLDVSANLGGVALGADYTFADNVRAGLSFHVGGGHAKGEGEINKTADDFNFWGVGAYAGWARSSFGLAADLSVTGASHDLEQDLPVSLGMGNLKSDIDSWALGAGLRGEYRFETNGLNIVPHASVRYTLLNTGSYKGVADGGMVLEGDAMRQNVWTFPVGVALSKDFDTAGGWSVRPSLDLGVVAAAGDVKAKGDVSFAGVKGKAALETQVLDRVSFAGQAGVELGKDKLSFGLNYNVRAGERNTAHGVFGTFRYTF